MNFINYRLPNKTDNHDDMDTSNKFIKNKLKLGKEWEYYDKDVKYIFNDQGFRGSTNVADYDWENSIVFFGDSCVFGCGLAEEDTVPKQVEKILGIPTINLAISGSAIDLSFNNSLVLKKHYPKPKAIVHFWTDADRYTDFREPSERIKTNRYLSKTPGYVARINWGCRSDIYVEAEREIWKDSVPRYEATFTQDSHKRYNVDYIPTIDLARDRFHPGTKTCKEAAISVINNLKDKI